MKSNVERGIFNLKKIDAAFPICFRTSLSYILSLFCLKTFISVVTAFPYETLRSIRPFLLLRTEDGHIPVYRGSTCRCIVQSICPSCHFVCQWVILGCVVPYLSKFHFYFALFISHKKLPTHLDSVYVWAHYCQIFNVRCVLVLVQLLCVFAIESWLLLSNSIFVHE